MTIQRNPIYEGALTLEDLKPGRRVAFMHPHLGPEPTYYTVRSLPYAYTSDDPHLGGMLVVDISSESGDYCEFAFLSDMGVVPFRGGRWNTNFVVWRSHGEFAGRRVQDNPLIQEAHARIGENWRDLDESW